MSGEEPATQITPVESPHLVSTEAIFLKGQAYSSAFTNDTIENALIIQDGLGYDWSYVAQDEPTSLLSGLHLNTSSGYEQLRAQLIVHQKNEVVYEEKISVLEFEVTRQRYGDQLNENDSSGSELFNSVFDSRSSNGDDNQTNDRFKKDNGYHDVPPPLTGNYFDLKYYSHLIKDYDFHEKRMAKSVLKDMGKVTGHREVRPVWNNTQRINHQNKFVPSAVLTRFGRVPVSAAKQSSFKWKSTTALKNTKEYLQGIKREFSVARTPQQNGVAKRKNMTLIEAARTMLVDSLLPTVFWAEVVNTACYQQGDSDETNEDDIDDNVVLKSLYKNTSNTTQLYTACVLHQDFFGDVGSSFVSSKYNSLTLPHDPLMPVLEDNRLDFNKHGTSTVVLSLIPQLFVHSIHPKDQIIGDPRKSLCIDFEQIIHKRFQMSSMGELTFFLGLQVKQKDDGIFISQDNYVGEILNKFGFSSIRTTSTPMETNKALAKDEKKVRIFQVQQKVSHMFAVKRIFRYLNGRPKLGLWYPKDSPFILEAFSDSDYAGANLDRKSTTGDGKAVVVSESSVRRDLHLNDEDGTACLTVNEIFENLTLMGYETTSDKLTFYKGFFSPQWKYLIHTILHCLSSKSTSWDQFSTNLASVIICLAKGQKFNFSKLIFDGMLRNLDPKKFLMYPRFLQLFLNIQLPNLVIPFNDIYETPKLTKKVFTNMRKPGKGFYSRVTQLFQNMLAPPVVVGEGSEQPTEPQPTYSTAPQEILTQFATATAS
ncbi:putative ribonuclease H-like domain-containing protein [Tanacetum coccineum]